MEGNAAQDEIQEILDTVPELSHGEPRLKEWQRAIDIADREKLLEQQIWLRLQYIEEAEFYEDGMKSIVMFPSLLNLLDEEQRTVGSTQKDVFDILWDYKWILNGAQYFYQVSPEQVERMAEDFRRRLLENGYSEYAYLTQMMHHYRRLDPMRAQEFYERFRVMKRDELGDCVACTKLKEMEVLLALGRREEALLCAQPILEKRMTCKVMPYALYGTFLEDAVRRTLAGEVLAVTEAEKLPYYAEQYRYAMVRLELLRGNCGILLQYYCLFDPDRALEWFRINCKFPEIWKKPEDILSFAYGAMLFFGKLLYKETYRMRMPREYVKYREDKQYSVRELYDFYRVMALELVEKFEKGKRSDIYRKDYEIYLNYSGSEQ